MGHFSGEFDRSGRDLVPAVLWAALLVGLLYLGTAVAVVGTGTYGGERTEAALTLVIRDSLGPAAGWLAGVLALLCTVAPANAYVGGAANLARSLATSGLAPRWLGASHPSRGTPVGGLAFLGLAFVPALALLGSGVFTVRDLLALPTAGFVATYALGAAAGVRLADGRAARRLALVALAASLLVYPFLGWAALYPALAGSAGLLTWRFGRPGGLPATPSRPHPRTTGDGHARDDSRRCRSRHRRVRRRTPRPEEEIRSKRRKER